MTASLRARGHEVVTIDPEAVAAEAGDGAWLDGLDLVVGRGRSHALLCLLTWAESCGVAVVNPRAAIAGVHDKAEMAIRLVAAGLPIPTTFIGPPAELAARVPAERYPLILKPHFGDNCRGLRLVATAGELARLSWPEPTALAQAFISNDGVDLKLYCIGRDVWAVRKPSPLNNGDGQCVLTTPTRSQVELARRCGELFGLDLYGVDCLETGALTVVVEVNEFPNYTGVPRAGDRLAHHVLSHIGTRRAQ